MGCHCRTVPGCLEGDRYFFSHPEKGKNQERGMGTSAVRLNIQKRKLRDMICDNNWSKVTRTQRLVFKMESAENPVVPCRAEKVDLDFDAIVREMNSHQEEIKKHLQTNADS